MHSTTRLPSQRTLRRPAAVTGVGYWSGRATRVELRPAPAGAGVVFVRDDLDVPVRIPVCLGHRVEAVARTNLSVAGVGVQMVEHVLSALAGLGVGCCTVHVQAEELPGLDGSAQAFVEAIDAAGVEDLGAPVEPIVVDRVVRVGDETSWIEASPPPCAGLAVDYELDYGDSAIGRQRLSLHVTPESYRQHLAAARTFLSVDEASRLQAAGLGTGVGHRDLLVFGPTGPIGNTLRWADECVRHKMLDLVGDLALAGRPIHASIRAFRSGHRLNAALAARLVAADRERRAA